MNTYLITHAESPRFAHCAKKFPLQSAHTKSIVAVQPCEQLNIIIIIIMSKAKTIVLTQVLKKFEGIIQKGKRILRY